MGTDLVPRLRSMEHLGLHYSAGGSGLVASLLLFCGAGGSAPEAIRHNCGYVRKKDAMLLADRLEALRRRLRKEDARRVLERRVLLSRPELETIVQAVARDIGAPEPSPSLLRDVVEMMVDPDWDYKYDLPHLIRLCRKGGGFWWS